MTETEFVKWKTHLEKDKDLWCVEFSLSETARKLVNLFVVTNDERHKYRNGTEVRERHLVRRIMAGSYDLNSVMGAFWDVEYIKGDTVKIFVSDHVSLEGTVKQVRDLFRTMAKNRKGMDGTCEGVITLKDDVKDEKKGGEDDA